MKEIKEVLELAGNSLKELRESVEKTEELSLDEMWILKNACNIVMLSEYEPLQEYVEKIKTVNMVRDLLHDMKDSQ